MSGITQDMVLRALAEWREEAPPTPAELAPLVYDKMRDPHRAMPTTEAERVASHLSGLATKGYAARLGRAESGARCWRITAAGLIRLERDW